MKKNLVFMGVVLFSAVLLDIPLASKFNVYFTVLCLAFAMVRLPFKEEISISILTGIAMDIFFSNYIGLITLIFFLTSVIALIARSYYKLKELALFYLLTVSMLTLMFLRVHFVGFGKTLVTTALLGIPVYFLLNAIIVKNENVPETL